MYDAETDPTNADSFEVDEVRTHDHHENWDYEALVEFVWDLTDDDGTDSDETRVTKQVLFNIKNGDVIFNHGHEYTHSVKVAIREHARVEFGSVGFEA